QEWSTSEWPEGYPPSRLELRLKAVPGGTELTLIQTGVPEEQADDYDQGWHDSYWMPMVKYFEQGKKRKAAESPAKQDHRRS
ncbi:MAG: SRPBCC domain-containing protein, partial [Methanomassiliicoccales archaeon]|nr:SRPBCC domain-containing protein [Methanomassiliicoccales archaeon]